MTPKPSQNPVQNPFQGVHPILHTLLQMEESSFDHKIFHSAYATQLSQRLNDQLMAYFARVEGKIDFAGRMPHPDTLLKNKPIQAWHFPLSANIATPDLVITLPRLSIATDILIGRTDNQGGFQPITAIEILSPAQLDYESELEAFRNKHEGFLASGLNVVTVHLLQTFPPITEDIPRYPDQAGSMPYHLTMARPQDLSEAGNHRMQVYRFGIDTPIPTLAVPLLGEDKIAVDFDTPYQITFTKTRFNQQIDYEAISPQVLSKFSATNQSYLERRLEAIRQSYEQEHDID
jgi:hypothetical protein